LTFKEKQLADFIHKLSMEHGTEIPMFTMEKAIILEFGSAKETITKYKKLLQDFGYAVFNMTAVRLKDKMIE